jgi:cytochrome c oxidase subunit 4
MTSHAPDEHDHAAVADHHHSPEEIRREMRTYWMIFGWLIFFTAVTVGICFMLKLPVHYAIMVAMAVAIIKGSLVAGFFMHLISEKKLIYGVLIMTVIFFIFLMSLPLSHYADRLK